MKYFMFFVLLAATNAGAAETISHSELPVVSDTTLMELKVSPSTFSYGNVIFQGYNESQTYSIFFCASDLELANRLSDANGGVVLVPGSKVLLKTAIGAAFGTGEKQQINTSKIQVSCELK